MEDTARLHVLAMTHPKVTNERLFGVAEIFDFNMVLESFRRLYPKKTFHENFPSPGQNLSVFEGRERSDELLKGFSGRGFLTLDECIAANVRPIAESSYRGKA